LGKGGIKEAKGNRERKTEENGDTPDSFFEILYCFLDLKTNAVFRFADEIGSFACMMTEVRNSLRRKSILFGLNGQLFIRTKKNRSESDERSDAESRYLKVRRIKVHCGK